MDAPPPPAPLSGPEPDPAARRLAWFAGSVWGIALTAVCVRAALFPHKQSVYAADYAPAGLHWLHGQPVYVYAKHFIYSPLCAAAFAPLGLLPDRAGNVVWRLLSAGCYLGVASLWLRSRLPGLGETAPLRAGVRALPAAFLLLLPLAVGNLNIGQLNVLVAAATAGAVLAAERGRWTLAALLLAAGGFMKIYPLAVGLLLAALFPRQLAGRLLGALAALFALTWLLGTPAYVGGAYREWFTTLGHDKRIDVELLSGWRDFAYLLRLGGLAISERWYRVLEAAGGAAAAGFLLLGQRRWGWGRERLLAGVFYLGSLWMVLFGPATEAATYLLLTLPICGAVAAVWHSPDPRHARLRPWLTAAYALLVSADLLNSWLNAGMRQPYPRALQPATAVLFAAVVAVWLLQAAPQRQDLP